VATLAGLDLAENRSSTRLDLALRMGLAVELWLTRRWALSYGFEARYTPSTIDILVEPRGKIAATPGWWLCQSLDVVFRIR
jgi:hypothetical protein